MYRVRVVRRIVNCATVSSAVTTTDVVIPHSATARDLDVRLPITNPIKPFATKNLSVSWA